MTTRKTWKLREIRSIINPEEEALIINEEYAFIVDMETGKLKMLFIGLADKRRKAYRKLDLQQVVEFIADKLKDKLDTKKFLEELILLHSGPEEIMELHERLQKPTAKITEAPLCISLMIGGKPGYPYEFNIVS